MGYYIQVPNDLKKAQQLVNLHQGEIIAEPSSFYDVPSDKALVCVVENELFDAAGICYDADEFKDFKMDDGRRKSWVLLEKTLAYKLFRFPMNEFL